MKSPIMWKLKSRFIIPTVILIFLGMSVSNAFYYFKSKEALLDSISDQLIHQADAVVRLMDEAIENIRLNFVYWSGDATLTTVVQELLKDMVQAPAHDLLEKIVADYGCYEKMTATDLKGVVISSSAEEEIGLLVGSEAFFKAAMKGDFYISDVYPSAATSEPVFTVAGPLFMEKEIVGVLSGVVSVSFFNENYVRPVKINEKGHAFLFGKDGVVIAHPDPSKIMAFNIDALGGGSGFPGKTDAPVHYTHEREDYIAAFRMSGKVGWTVGVCAEKNELLSPVERLTFLNIGVLLLVFVAVIFALFALVNIISGQLGEIMKLKIAKEGAEAASGLKSEFLANMSHEIRTPMNAVLGFSDLLRSEITEPRQKTYLESIIISGKNLLRLINDILDLSKIEAGKLELNPEPVDPRVLFNEIKKIFTFETAGKGLDFVISMAPDIPRGLMLDEVRLRQILVNLVGNAVKFTEKGSIELAVEVKKRRRKNRRLDLQITVTDTGVGISPGFLKGVFDSFSQQPGQSGKNYGGTGLGLNITKKLVEIMNGAISVKSEVGQGSRFTILLEGVALASASGLPDKQAMEVENIRFNGETVLVVDENELNRVLVREILQSVNLTVKEAENGEDGVARARQYKPDVILMDLKMPVMDGFEAARRIQNDPALEKIPIIALTASAMKEDRARIQRRKFDDHVGKPVDKLVLFRSLARFLDYTTSSGEASAPRGPVSKAPPPAAPADAPENLPGLIKELEALTARWETASQKQYIPDIKAFGEDLEALGERFGARDLGALGKNLLLHIDSYDIEQIFGALKTYPDLVENLKNLQ
ncbi:MAG: response regulator [Desulfobacterales bacterium]|nr:response regulator [Desulfobacterales bacterium]